MKKLTYFCLFLASITLWSCRDSSGDYVEQLRTNSELTTSLRACLQVSKDTALNHLCVPDGFYESTEYKLALSSSSALRTIADTLDAHGKRYLLDTLERQVNRACEQIGNTLSSNFETTISSLTFRDPESLVYTDDYTAATSYFKVSCAATVQSFTTSALSDRMQAIGANATWNEIKTIYYESGAGFVSYDLLGTATNNMLNAIYTEMGKEETNIRKDPGHVVQGALQAFWREYFSSDEE